MTRAQHILDECVFGLDESKLQIMQMLGQWLTNPSAMGTAIAIKGSPGTGKTSLIKDGISKILGREFVFIPLGGAGDGSYLEGHSYTYEGSMWGKIVQTLMDCKCMNPVIYFDELDKVSETPRGEEIIGILTHLTDTSQNMEFHDKYFSEIREFDLSKCLFIFSYNDETKVNPILLNRMYVIQTKGYAADEKMVIARKYLLPKICQQVNIPEDKIVLTDEIMRHIITDERLSRKEDGVRNLKRCLEIIHTKLNLYRVMSSSNAFFQKYKDIPKNVEFPFQLTRKDLDVLIKNNENLMPTYLTMYN
jgi:ATP-dependent Lon protease